MFTLVPLASESKPATFYEVHVIVSRTRIGGVWAVSVVGYCTYPGFKYGYACKHIVWLANKVTKSTNAD